MNDLKEFLKKQKRDVVHSYTGEVYFKFRDLDELDNVKATGLICIKDLGLFFWGKLELHILNCQKQLNDLKERQKKCKQSEFDFFKNHLDSKVKYKEESMQKKYKGMFVGENKVYYEISVACLGEKRVKELIKELKE
jgi:hypothetical protein